MEDNTLKYRKYIRWFWILFASPFVILILVFILILSGVMGFMPSFEELENPKSNLASEVYSSDGQLLGKYYRQNRTVVNFQEISSWLVKALVATEDARFYEHSGIDGRSLGRVLFKSVLLRQGAGGGSTISQQLAKNLFPRDTSHYSSGFTKKLSLATTKFKEWVTAVKLERNYTKEEILVMYLNTVPFGSETYGIKSASRTFFNKNSDSVKIEEAAVLIGLLKAPTYYNPKLHPERSKERRNTVMTQMVKYGYLKQKEYDSLSKLPIKLKYKLQTHREGLATYFREYLRLTMTAEKPEAKNYKFLGMNKFREDSTEWADNPLYGWCNKNVKPDGTNYDLYTDGIKIVTTINSKMQQYAEESVMEHMGLGKEALQDIFDNDQKGKKKAPFSYQLTDKQIADILETSMRRSERYRSLKQSGLDTAKIRKNFLTPTEMKVFSWKGEKDTIMSPMDSIRYSKRFLHAGFVSIEPQTGYVRAYVGDINYQFFKYDHVMLSRRQVGSTFKPFVYTMAMMPGELSPCYKVPNVAVSFEMPNNQPPYTPRHSASSRDGEMITLRYGLANSLNQISAWIMKKYGPKAIVDLAKKMGVRSPLDPVYALCVGAAEVKLSEMVAAYGTFANKGIYVTPVVVQRVEDKNGNVISIFKAKKHQVMSEGTAFRMLYLMQAVINEGTGSRLRGKYQMTNEIAGKTGTTNDNSDGWFIATVPNLVSGAWVGGEERSIRFNNSYFGQGASMALPIWGLFMQKVYKNGRLNVSQDRFEEPEDDDGVSLECNEYEKTKDEIIDEVY